MDDFAGIAKTAVSWQRFTYVGVAALALMVASFSNTERRLFDGGGVPAAFSAVPAGVAETALAALPLLGSIAFSNADEPGPTPAVTPAGTSALVGGVPGAIAGLTPAPAELALASPPAAPETAASAPLGFAGTPAASGGGRGRARLSAARRRGSLLLPLLISQRRRFR